MHKIVQTCFLLLLLSSALPGTHADQISPPDFDQEIAPIIAQRCVSCHSGHDPKGMLDLSTRASAMKGGESGSAIDRDDLSNSLLWLHIEADVMPPKKPLTMAEKEKIRAWIDGGAPWGTEKIDPFRFSTEARAGIDWWSLQPLLTPIPPHSMRADLNADPIDAFIDAKRNAAGLGPSRPADRSTLIRRLSFDLIGLPPSPAEIEDFLNDTSEDAIETLVDRLLTSPHYGERWARHWLDIVRFGESNGFEYDQPRDNAWHYRNWVIDALNRDLPYDEFVRLQLVGDITHPDQMDSASAAGFLVAGAHNTTLPANDKMRMSMAQDEIEDLVAVVSQTFLGLTANCARCHDHKFDPISQKEYYQLAATLSGVSHGERTIQVPMKPEQQLRLAAIDTRLAAIQSLILQIKQPVRKAIIHERERGVINGPAPPHPIAAWEFDGDLKDRFGTLHAVMHGSAKIEDGCLVLDGLDAYAETVPLKIDLAQKTLEAWVQLANLEQSGGGVISIQSLGGAAFDAIVFGEREPGRWMAGSNGFVRTMPFNGPSETDAARSAVHVAIVYKDDGTIIGYRGGKPYGMSYRPRELQHYAKEESQVLFGLRHSPVGGNRLLAGRIERAQLYDRALTPEEVAASAGVSDRDYVSDSQLLARLSPEQRAAVESLDTEQLKIQAERDAIIQSQSQKVYTCISAKPGISHVLLRGDVGSPAEEVAPAGLSAIVGINPDFGLAMDSSDADRRRALAAWITHPDNPLFARVIVNRIWQYHFGQGLVKTTSDFGFNGGLPSHPELLDWLAQSLRSGGFRLKPLHRLIVLSASYRQSAAINEQAVGIDAENRLLWRKTPQRLDAEEIRDAVLVATGKLNREIGGPGYRDVRHFQFKGSNFYESISEDSEETYRRTIYRFNPRGGRNPFLDTFDCPDPSAAAPQRGATTTPLQALALMNNELIFQLSDDFAERIVREAGNEPTDQVRLIHIVAIGRTADDNEISLALPFIAQHGLAAYCRVIVNSNAFLYVR